MIGTLLGGHCCSPLQTVALRSIVAFSVAASLAAPSAAQSQGQSLITAGWGPVGPGPGGPGTSISQRPQVASAVGGDAEHVVFERWEVSGNPAVTRPSIYYSNRTPMGWVSTPILAGSLGYLLDPTLLVDGKGTATASDDTVWIACRRVAEALAEKVEILRKDPGSGSFVREGAGFGVSALNNYVSEPRIVQMDNGTVVACWIENQIEIPAPVKYRDLPVVFYKEPGASSFVLSSAWRSAVEATLPHEGSIADLQVNVLPNNQLLVTYLSNEDGFVPGAAANPCNPHSATLDFALGQGGQLVSGADFGTVPTKLNMNGDARDTSTLRTTTLSDGRVVLAYTDNQDVVFNTYQPALGGQWTEPVLVDSRITPPDPSGSNLRETALDVASNADAILFVYGRGDGITETINLEAASFDVSLLPTPSTPTPIGVAYPSLTTLVPSIQYNRLAPSYTQTDILERPLAFANGTFLGAVWEEKTTLQALTNGVAPEHLMWSDQYVLDWSDIRLATANTDGSGGWTTVTPALNEPEGFAGCENPFVHVGPGRITVAWEDRRHRYFPQLSLGSLGEDGGAEIYITELSLVAQP